MKAVHTCSQSVLHTLCMNKFWGRKTHFTNIKRRRENQTWDDYEQLQRLTEYICTQTQNMFRTFVTLVLKYWQWHQTCTHVKTVGNFCKLSTGQPTCSARSVDSDLSSSCTVAPFRTSCSCQNSLRNSYNSPDRSWKLRALGASFEQLC